MKIVLDLTGANFMETFAPEEKYAAATFALKLY